MCGLVPKPACDLCMLDISPSTLPVPQTVSPPSPSPSCAFLLLTRGTTTATKTNHPPSRAVWWLSHISQDRVVSGSHLVSFTLSFLKKYFFYSSSRWFLFIEQTPLPWRSLLCSRTVRRQPHPFIHSSLLGSYYYHVLRQLQQGCHTHINKTNKQQNKQDEERELTLRTK